jgi:hypothetical protein
MGGFEQVFGDLAYHYFPHRYCLSFNPALILIEATTSLLIFAAYMAMPIIFMFDAFRSRVPYWWMLAGFILFCGFWHLADFANLTSPDWYEVSSAIDAMTVIFSVPAAYSLYRMMRLWRQRDVDLGLLD